MYRTLRTSCFRITSILPVILISIFPIQNCIGQTGTATPDGTALKDQGTESLSSYVLQLQDIVSIQVFGEEDLSKTQRIDGSGNIRMGLIGTINIAGLTLRDAETKLEQAFVIERYLRDPQVSIQIEEYAPQFISVLGQVTTPGRIKLEIESTGMRLVDAISAVGGFSGIAKKDAVRITRASRYGSEQTVTIDAEALINGRETNIPVGFEILKPGDVVFVPERLF